MGGYLRLFLLTASTLRFSQAAYDETTASFGHSFQIAGGNTRSEVTVSNEFTIDTYSAKPHNLTVIRNRPSATADFVTTLDTTTDAFAGPWLALKKYSYKLQVDDGQTDPDDMIAKLEATFDPSQLQTQNILVSNVYLARYNATRAGWVIDAERANVKIEENRARIIGVNAPAGEYLLLGQVNPDTQNTFIQFASAQAGVTNWTTNAAPSALGTPEPPLQVGVWADGLRLQVRTAQQLTIQADIQASPTQGLPDSYVVVSPWSHNITYSDASVSCEARIQLPYSPSWLSSQDLLPSQVVIGHRKSETDHFTILPVTLTSNSGVLTKEALPEFDGEYVLLGSHTIQPEMVTGQEDSACHCSSAASSSQSSSSSSSPPHDSCHSGAPTDTTSDYPSVSSGGAPATSNSTSGGSYPSGANGPSNIVSDSNQPDAPSYPSVSSGDAPDSSNITSDGRSPSGPNPPLNHPDASSHPSVSSGGLPDTSNTTSGGLYPPGANSPSSNAPVADGSTNDAPCEKSRDPTTYGPNNNGSPATEIPSSPMPPSDTPQVSSGTGDQSPSPSGDIPAGLNNTSPGPESSNCTESTSPSPVDQSHQYPTPVPGVNPDNGTSNATPDLVSSGDPYPSPAKNDFSSGSNAPGSAHPVNSNCTESEVPSSNTTVPSRLGPSVSSGDQPYPSEGQETPQATDGSPVSDDNPESPSVSSGDSPYPSGGQATPQSSDGSPVSSDSPADSPAVSSQEPQPEGSVGSPQPPNLTNDSNGSPDSSNHTSSTSLSHNPIPVTSSEEPCEREKTISNRSVPLTTDAGPGTPPSSQDSSTQTSVPSYTDQQVPVDSPASSPAPGDGSSNVPAPDSGSQSDGPTNSTDAYTLNTASESPHQIDNCTESNGLKSTKISSSVPETYVNPYGNSTETYGPDNSNNETQVDHPDNTSQSDGPIHSTDAYTPNTASESPNQIDNCTESDASKSTNISSSVPETYVNHYGNSTETYGPDNSNNETQVDHPDNASQSDGPIHSTDAYTPNESSESPNQVDNCTESNGVNSTNSSSVPEAYVNTYGNSTETYGPDNSTETYGNFTTPLGSNNTIDSTYEETTVDGSTRPHECTHCEHPINGSTITNQTSSSSSSSSSQTTTTNSTLNATSPCANATESNTTPVQAPSNTSSILSVDVPSPYANDTSTFPTEAARPSKEHCTECEENGHEGSITNTTSSHSASSSSAAASSSSTSTTSSPSSVDHPLIQTKKSSSSSSSSSATSTSSTSSTLSKFPAARLRQRRSLWFD